MDDSPAFKRRRLNAVNKPFKSPLKTSASQKEHAPGPSLLGSTPVKSISDDTHDAFASRAIHSGSFSTPVQNKTYATRPAIRATPTANTSNSPASQEIQDALKQIRSLESSLMKARQDIDTLNQAMRLINLTKDAELSDLADKWRVAARQASEEVFAGARDKVNRMGGVGAWRERQREMAERANDWSEQQQDDDDEEEVYDENGDLINVVKIEKEEKFEDEWEYDAEMKKEQKQEEGRDDDASLHIMASPSLSTSANAL